MSAPADARPCDDGNECTSGDACAAGSCKGAAIPGCCGSDADCADDDLCTRDRCVDHACTNAAISCNVPDLCVVGFCDPSSGSCSSAPLFCDDGDACTADRCNSGVGCVHAPQCECADTAESCSNGTSCVSCVGHFDGSACANPTAAQPCGCLVDADCPSGRWCDGTTCVECGDGGSCGPAQRCAGACGFGNYCGAASICRSCSTDGIDTACGTSCTNCLAFGGHCQDQDSPP
jgi:hypothetical protein